MSYRPSQESRTAPLPDRDGATLDVLCDSALLGERGNDPVYGARPSKQFVQQELETPMARLIVKGELRDGETASVDLKNGELVVVPTVTGEQTPSSTR